MKNSALFLSACLALASARPWGSQYFGSDPSNRRADKAALLAPYINGNPYGGPPLPVGKSPFEQAPKEMDVLYPAADEKPAEPELEKVPKGKPMPSPSEMAFGPGGQQAEIEKAREDYLDGDIGIDKEGEKEGEEVSEEEEEEEEDKMSGFQHQVNSGGVQRGSGRDGPTNFHVYSDENGQKRYSDQLDPETEEYIRERMLPKLRGTRKNRAGGDVWDVFGP